MQNTRCPEVILPLVLYSGLTSVICLQSAFSSFLGFDEEIAENRECVGKKAVCP